MKYKKCPSCRQSKLRTHFVETNDPREPVVCRFCAVGPQRIYKVGPKFECDELLQTWGVKHGMSDMRQRGLKSFTDARRLAQEVLSKMSVPVEQYGDSDQGIDHAVQPRQSGASAVSTTRETAETV